MRQLVILLLALSPLCVIAKAQDQDSPSLADVARQSRAQKQQKDGNDGQAKDAPARDPSKPTSATDVASKTAVAPKASHVITNEDLPEHAVSTAPARSDFKVSSTTDLDPGGNQRQQLAEQFKSQLRDQNKAITELQNQIAEASDSIPYAGGNCLSHCVQWNEHQQQKQQEVDTLKAQLDEGAAPSGPDARSRPPAGFWRLRVRPGLEGRLSGPPVGEQSPCKSLASSCQIFTLPKTAASCEISSCL